MGTPVEMAAECWVWFFLALCAVVGRFTSQYFVRKRNFIKEVPPDEFLMLITALTYTTAIISFFTYFELMSNIDLDNITPDDNFVKGRQLGILNILAETAMQTTLWGNKTCILLLYIRLTYFGHHRRLWMLVSAYIGLTYVAVIVSLYGGWCRPFTGYLVLVPDNLECLTWKHYNILQMTCNLSTDLILLVQPLWLISRLQMKLGKKLLLVCLFSLGIFVMLAATLTKVSVFLNSTAPVWFLWCVREVSTAMLVGNLALCMPIFRMCWRFLFPHTGITTAQSNTSAGVTTKKSAATCDTGCGESSRWGSSPARSRLNEDVELEAYGNSELMNSKMRFSIGEQSV